MNDKNEVRLQKGKIYIDKETDTSLQEHYKSHTTEYKDCLSLTAATIHTNKIGKNSARHC